jgi:hypothetical protein
MARLRELIVPREHGVWGLLAGAALVGLPLGGGIAGIPLLIAGVCAAMLRQAMSVKSAGPRRFLVAALLAGLAAALVASTAMLAVSLAWLSWLVASILTGAICLLPTSGRPWWITAIAGLSAGLLAGAVAVAGGAGMTTALIAAAALAAHLTSVVPLVRAQLRSDPRWSALALDLHVLALLGAAALWATGLATSGIPLVFGMGLARAVHLVDKRTPMSSSPARIGTREMAWLLVLAAGVHLGLRGATC